jgi:transcriptional regulator with XRE-family HTH domain
VGRTPATIFFGSELRRAREAAGLSREEFGALVKYAASTIGAFETGDRFPQIALVEGADKHLSTGGLFGRMYEQLLTSYVYPESFRPWIDIERHATALRSYELAYAPGLLQTEAYARALLQSGRGDVESRVTARMERQQVLRGERPPEYVAVLDEGILRRPVGGRQVMRDQLRSLAEASERWIIQILPWEVDNYTCLNGPFVLATVDGKDLVYTPTQLTGYIVNESEAVADLKWRWDAIRAEALPRRQSKDLILEWVSKYE